MLRFVRGQNLVEFSIREVHPGALGGDERVGDLDVPTPLRKPAHLARDRPRLFISFQRLVVTPLSVMYPAGVAQRDALAFPVVQGPLDGQRLLVGLEGRQPIEYPTEDGRIVHSMELTRLMRRYPVLRYELRSRGEFDYQLEYAGDIDQAALTSELAELFGNSISLLKMEEMH